MSTDVFPEYHLLSLEMMLSPSLLHCYHLGYSSSILHATSWIFGPLWLLGGTFCSLVLLLGRGCSYCILFGESTLTVSKYCYDENNEINIFHYFYHKFRNSHCVILFVEKWVSEVNREKKESNSLIIK